MPLRLAPAKARGSAALAALVLLGAYAARGEAPADRLEVIPPGEAAAIEAIVAMTERALAASARNGPALRDAHPKGHGCVVADFTTEADLPVDLTRGVFAEARTYPAWIRFSNGNPKPRDDREGDVRGMAIKLVGVGGKKLLDDESNAATQDFVLVDFPRFFLPNAAEYVAFTGEALQGRREAHLAQNPDQKAVLDAMESRTMGHLLTQRYFSTTPSLLGERPVKLGARPAACGAEALPEPTLMSPGDDPDRLRAGMASWLNAGDACFRFTVQRQTDATMPVEDPTVLWDEARSPPIEVATIRIPRQTFDSPAQQAYCENLSFTPWHSLPEHRPLGGINRVRKAAYLVLSKLRHRLNQAPRAEPTGIERFP